MKSNSFELIKNTIYNVSNVIKYQKTEWFD